MGVKKNKWLYGLIITISVVSTSSLFVMCSNSQKENDNEINTSSSNNNELLENNNKEEILEDELESKVESEENDIEVDESLLMLVNKENLLDSSYVPENLVLSEIEFLSYIETRNLTKETAEAAKAMFDAAKEDGITLLGASGYRSYDIQVNLFNSRAADVGEEAAAMYTAPPGASEHQTGLALDILGEDYQYMDEDFDKSESFKWLIENSYKYGFILRFLKGKEDITGYGYEPWHFRYIGNSEIAKEIMDRGITLEEYLLENEE